MTIISDVRTTNVSPITIVSDAPRCGATYDCHSDNPRGVIYSCIVFIVKATEHEGRRKKIHNISTRLPYKGFPNSVVLSSSFGESFHETKVMKSRYVDMGSML